MIKMTTFFRGKPESVPRLAPAARQRAILARKLAEQAAIAGAATYRHDVTVLARIAMMLGTDPEWLRGELLKAARGDAQQIRSVNGTINEWLGKNSRGVPFDSPGVGRR